MTGLQKRDRWSQDTRPFFFRQVAEMKKIREKIYRDEHDSIISLTMHGFIVIILFSVFFLSLGICLRRKFLYPTSGFGASIYCS